MLQLPSAIDERHIILHGSVVIQIDYRNPISFVNMNNPRPAAICAINFTLDPSADFDCAGRVHLNSLANVKVHPRRALDRIQTGALSASDVTPCSPL